MSYFEEMLMKLADSPAIDAFARLRVSNPTTLFDNSFEYGLNAQRFSNSLVGAGSITHLPNEAAAQLATGSGNSGDSAILQTKPYIRYQPGKSQLILITGSIGAAKANVAQRVGYFDANNGLFFEQLSTGMGVVVRTKTSGSPVDTRVARSSWNLDKMDGTGVSGVNLDFTKSQIFMIDFEWLGAGRVRFGFVVDGLPVYCHEVLNANIQPTVYMTTANLPIRAEITNTGAASGTTTMKQFCMAVMSEGGFSEDLQRQFAIGRGTSSLAVTIRRPVLSIRPRVQFNSIVNRGHVIFSQLELLAGTNNCLWELVYNGSLTNASFADVDTNESIVEYDMAADAISGGIVLDRGWAISGLGAAIGRASQEVRNVELFNDFAETTPDKLSIVCTSFSGTSNINALMRWKEQR